MFCKLSGVCHTAGLSIVRVQARLNGVGFRPHVSRTREFRGWRRRIGEF